MVSPVVINKLRRVVFSKNEPDSTVVLWGKPVGDAYSFLAYTNGAWQPIQISGGEGGDTSGFKFIKIGEELYGIEDGIVELPKYSIVSVSQNSSTGKTTINVDSNSYDIVTSPVRVSQNTETGKTAIRVGNQSVDVQSALNYIEVLDATFDVTLYNIDDVLYLISINDLVRRTETGFDRITLRPNDVLLYKDGQKASYNGKIVTEQIDAFDLINKTELTDLKYVNRKVSSVTGEVGEEDPARLCSDIFIAQDLHISIAQGYAIYYYLYDLDGTYKCCNENNNTGDFNLKFPFACKLRIVFKHIDGTTAIPSIEGVVSSSDGLYLYTSQLNDGQVTASKLAKDCVETDKIKNYAVSLEKINDSAFGPVLSESNRLVRSKDIHNYIEYDKLPIVAQGVVLFDTEHLQGVVSLQTNVLRATNVFNKDAIVLNKIRNNAGDVIDDQTSSYCSEMIPVKGGCFIKSNVNIQRIYYLGIDGSMLYRTEQAPPNTTVTIPSQYSGQDIYFIQFQFVTSNLSDVLMINYTKEGYPQIPSDFVAFAKATGNLFDDCINILWLDNFGEFEYNILVNKDILLDEKLFTDNNPWEPSNVDTGYSNPTSGWGDDTFRDDWTATDKYLYYDFLAHYYDVYLGENDNYKVSKKSIWEDSSNTGHEVFEYDFCPKNYKYTILLSAGMNANETQGIWGLATLMRCIYNEEEPMLTLAKHNVRFKIIPIINASGFDQAQLRYLYSDGVNPNFNFNYKNSWYSLDKPTTLKGTYPDSNLNTKELKKWLNQYSGIALLWIDMHTGRWEDMYPNKYILDVRFGNTQSYFSEFNSIDVPLIKTFYKTKGYVTDSDNIGGAYDFRSNLDYQKHRYAVDMCGINSAMTEMHIESTGYGADGFTNNSANGIKAYVLQMRQLIMYAINKYITTHLNVNLGDSKIGRLHNLYK